MLYFYYFRLDGSLLYARMRIHRYSPAFRTTRSNRFLKELRRMKEQLDLRYSEEEKRKKKLISIRYIPLKNYAQTSLQRYPIDIVLKFILFTYAYI